MTTLNSEVHISDALHNTKDTHVDSKLEVIVISVSDVTGRNSSTQDSVGGLKQISKTEKTSA